MERISSMFKAFNEDPETYAVIMIGEIGGLLKKRQQNG